MTVKELFGIIKKFKKFDRQTYRRNAVVKVSVGGKILPVRHVSLEPDTDNYCSHSLNILNITADAGDYTLKLNNNVIRDTGNNETCETGEYLCCPGGFSVPAQHSYSIKIGDPVIDPATMRIGRVEGAGSLSKINKSKISVDFATKTDSMLLLYEADNCPDNILYVKFPGIPDLQKFQVYEVELLPADYGDIIRIDESGEYGTLDRYIISGFNEDRKVDGLYIKVKNSENTLSTYVPLSEKVTNLSNPNLQMRRNLIANDKVMQYLNLPSTEESNAHLLLVGINYDRKSKTHTCRIEKWE